MNTYYVFDFHGAELWALAEGALFWPSQNLLCVSDLHLGKSDRIARRSGQMLPPFEITDTLSRLAALIDTHAPKMVICLGDSFDDLDASTSLTQTNRQDLARMKAGRRWIWIEGNHDPGPVDIGGEHLAEFSVTGITFRHIAEPDKTAEISGHYHPKCGLSHGGKRPAFLVDNNRLILPAFGTYTGGLSGRDAAFSQVIAPDAIAILTGRKALPVPLAATK